MVMLGHTRTNVDLEYLENKGPFWQRVQNASILLKKWKMLTEQMFLAQIQNHLGRLYTWIGSIIYDVKLNFRPSKILDSFAHI